MKKFFINLVLFLCFPFFGLPFSKKNNSAEIQSKQESIWKSIDTVARKNNLISKEPSIYPIYDGIWDVDSFLKQKYRVMWILKEAIDLFDQNNDPIGGGWMITEGEKSHRGYECVSLTWRRMMQVNYGILKETKDFYKIPKVTKYNMLSSDIHCQLLKSIIYINTNKMPGPSTSNDSDISRKYEIWKCIIKQQIDVYNPDIVIFGGTFRFYKRDFSNIFNSTIPSAHKYGKFVHNAFSTSDGKLIIDATHPAYCPMPNKDELYFMNVIDAVKDWEKKRL